MIPERESREILKRNSTKMSLIWLLELIDGDQNPFPPCYEIGAFVQKDLEKMLNKNSKYKFIGKVQKI